MRCSARAIAMRHAEAACEALRVLPDTPARACLVELAAYSVRRDR